jgi:hypothetical protein
MRDPIFLIGDGVFCLEFLQRDLIKYNIAMFPKNLIWDGL